MKQEPAYKIKETEHKIFIVLPKENFAMMLFLEIVAMMCGTVKINIKEKEFNGTNKFMISLSVDELTINEIIEHININLPTS